ncbi:hypothetical protein ACFSKL_08420 [Belliella marina]|uniref:6-bladed beta-propeller protein n=1 Tax=Belliella marina TaxID=1644146 RepID=A0ABW4VLC6_9BACT
MKNQLYIILLVGLVACSKDNNKIQSTSIDYELVITDSIQVNHLQQLTLVDIEDGRILAKNQATSTYVIFDEKGNINSQIELKTDGPNAINMSYSEGFFEGKFTIMDRKKGIIQFSDEGNIIKNFTILEDYIYLNPFNKPIFTIGDKLAYYRPERDMSDWEKPEEFYRRIYNLPILEVLDPKTNETKLKMEIPETSVYKDGDFHFVFYPQIVKRGKIWYLFLMAEMKFYVYEEKGEELIFKESVSLNFKDQIPFPSASMKNPYELFSKLDKVVSSMIEQLYAFDDKIILIYRKGAGENIVQNYDKENQSEWEDFFQSLPKYAAVFDSEYKLLQDNIELPSGTLSTPILTQDGHILVHKNQRLLGEEDWNTYYKLKLTEKREVN